MSSSLFRLYLRLFIVLYITFWVLILSIPMIMWWSDPISAPFLFRTSRSVFSNSGIYIYDQFGFPPCLSLSGDIHITLCPSLCGKIVLPITRHCFPQSSIKRCPFSFSLSQGIPYLPFTCSMSWLLFPTYALKSPIISIISLLLILIKVLSRRLWKASFSLRSVFSVGA